MKSKSPPQTITCSPEVFSIPTKKRNRNLIALMMPFDEEYSAVSNTIKDAAEKCKMKCERADDVWQNECLVQDVFELIYCSAMVVCDFTARNPNVFYEAGIAHTLGRTIIPIAQSKDDIPFDIKHQRCVFYSSDESGLAKLKKRLVSRIRTVNKILLEKYPPKRPRPRYVYDD